jgi:YidC/Oxa1 family membrane protein insertase
MEKRLLLAFVLSAAILMAWSILFPPPQRPASTPERQPIASPESPAPSASATATTPTSEAESQPPVDEEIAEPSFDAVGAESVEEVVLGNEAIRVVLTNRGAAVSSYQLLAYDGDAGEVLDLIQTVELPTASLPLQLVGPSGPDTRLFAVESNGDEARFVWSDGRGGRVEKRIGLSGPGYGLDFEISAAGAPSGEVISIGTGMRNLGEAERDSRLALWGEGILLADGEVERFKRRKVKAPQVVPTGAVTYAGFEDAYFLNVVRPVGGVSEVRIDPLRLSQNDDDEQTVLQINLRPTQGLLRGQLLGAPKEYDLLREEGQGLEKTLDFGIFSPISVFFLKALRWIYTWAGNWGVAIILLTLGIRIVLFPLMHTSTVSMRKMAKVQPKVKEIQAKYKKKKSDPQARAKMNQEMMALYKAEGVNPMAGCLPLLVQLPLLWALYQLFLRAIELRHAPFMLWITDLSAKDPLYVTPILMTATMWLQQRLAPQAGDPQQQRIMRMMPLIFGIMFLQFPAGLVLYWLANNVITILQQEITLHLVGERRLPGSGRRKGSKK